jgi:hypothetical protein
MHYFDATLEKMERIRDCCLFYLVLAIRPVHARIAAYDNSDIQVVEIMGFLTDNSDNGYQFNPDSPWEKDLDNNSSGKRSVKRSPKSAFAFLDSYNQMDFSIPLAVSDSRIHNFEVESYTKYAILTLRRMVRPLN